MQLVGWTQKVRILIAAMPIKVKIFEALLQRVERLGDALKVKHRKLVTPLYRRRSVLRVHRRQERGVKVLRSGHRRIVANSRGERKFSTAPDGAPPLGLGAVVLCPREEPPVVLGEARKPLI